MAKSVLFLVWVFLAVLCVFYGIIVRAVGSGTLFFIIWFLIAAVFLFFAFCVKKNIWAVLPGPLKKVFLLLVAAGLIVFIVVEAIIISGFDDSGEEDLDYVIVLGAQVYASGPSPVLKFRLDRAIEYLEENTDTICICSGGQGFNEPAAEARIMADYLIRNGISEDRVLMEDKSETTEQNIQNCMTLMEEGARVGLVTNNFHLFRALTIARKQGLTNVCGIAAGTQPLYLPNNMLREFMAVIKMWLKSLI